MKQKSGAKKRRPGRRGPDSGGGRLNHNSIVAAGLALTKSVALQDVSIVRLARELGVTPASIHYYVDGREALTSGVVYLFFQELLSDWPEPKKTAPATLEAVARTIYRRYVRYPGIVSYFAGQNRFRLLVQSGRGPGSENLYRFIERYFAAIESVGLSAQNVAVYGFVLIQFIIAAAHATASHQLPGEQRKLGDLLSELGRKEYPTVQRIRRSYLALSGDEAFAVGVRLILAGMKAERS